MTLVDRTRHVLPALLAALLGACQSLPPPVPDRAPPARSIEVPFHAQEKYQCGPAALAMMLGWADRPTAPTELVGEVWLPERQGSLIMEMKAAARARGLLVVPVNTPDALFRELEAGHPVLVMQNLGLSFWPQWHFAVAKGYRNNGSEVLLHSGTDADTPSHWNRFVRTWARADYRAFVVLPAGELPATAETRDLVRALENLRTVAGREAVLPHWRAAAQQRPDDYLLQFGLGNVLWENGRRRQARDAFRRATELNPDSAAAWNNLAEAWLQTGCPGKALAPAERAHELDPDNPAIGDTLERVKAAQGDAGSSCSPDGASSG